MIDSSANMYCVEKSVLMKSNSNERGAALVVSLVMLLLILLLGISGARIALQGEKSSQNDRDRQIAFQAAEAALMDAELDIEGSPDRQKSRSHIFSTHSRLGFPEADQQRCQTGDMNPYQGLCRLSENRLTPVWQAVDITNDASPSRVAVPFGKFTGRSLQTGAGNLPKKLPQYVIELMRFHGQGERADEVSYFYRITAIGFGARRGTEVVLQSYYRKDSK